MHELPTNPPGVISTFENLCRTFPPNSIPELRNGVETAVLRVSRLKERYLGPNLQTAEEIARRLYYLIDNYRNFPEAKHHLIVGALRYFIIEKDSLPDYQPIVGFDDDIQVLNYVLEQLGVTDMFLEIAG